MGNPRVFIAYAPRGIGLRCALAYLSSERDVYGWFTGPNGANSIASLYFVLEDFYSTAETRYVAAQALDLHTGWILDEARCHELAKLQEAFAAEWLLGRNDTRAAAELAAYARDELATGQLNLRHSRLAKLSKQQPNWTYYSPDFERPVLTFLSRRWPLEYRPEVD
jgi:hypothetical protein